MLFSKDGYRVKEEGPSTLVADQNQAHAIYAELAQLIKQKGRQLHKSTDIPIVEELPVIQALKRLRANLPCQTLHKEDLMLS